MSNGDKRITREQGVRMTLTALLSYLPLIPVFWFLVKPVLITAVSEAVAGDIQAEVEKGIRPINSAFKILLQNQINGKKKEAAALENKRQFHADEWTDRDAETLIECRIEIESLIAARRAL